VGVGVPVIPATSNVTETEVCVADPGTKAGTVGAAEGATGVGPLLIVLKTDVADETIPDVFDATVWK